MRATAFQCLFKDSGSFCRLWWESREILSGVSSLPKEAVLFALTT